MEGAIPPLSSLTKRKNLPQFVGKVTRGAPVLMGTPPSQCRGRMPVFGYLTEDEAADVYLYLTLHPPGGAATAVASVTSTSQMPPHGASIGARLPMAAKAQHIHANDCGPCAVAGNGHAAPTTRDLGEEQLALTVREPVRSR